MFLIKHSESDTLMESEIFATKIKTFSDWHDKTTIDFVYSSIDIFATVKYLSLNHYKIQKPPPEKASRSGFCNLSK